MRALLIGLLAALAAMPAAAIAQVAAPAPAPIEVMILGTYHMGNPGRDLANMQADDVTRPDRQAEIQAVTDALATWRPTRILVEVERPAPFTVDRYRAFRPEDLQTSRNETVQIAYRLARQLGHEDVYGFDEQGGEGEPDYFQWGRLQTWANANGRSRLLEETMAYFQNMVAEEGRAQATHTIAELLIRQNDPDFTRSGHSRGYYGMLALGDAGNQVGAEFNAYWYMRNAKMFGKVALIARPGDRVLVLVGSGHRYWLNHFAETAPGFAAIDPIPYLRRAAAASPPRR